MASHTADIWSNVVLYLHTLTSIGQGQDRVPIRLIYPQRMSVHTGDHALVKATPFLNTMVLAAYLNALPVRADRPAQPVY